MATSAMAGHEIEMMGATKPQRRTESLAERNRALFEAQRKARRGPTPEVFFAKHIDNTRLVKADDPERRREMRHFAGVMSMLFVLVMVYVWQHFLAIEIGYKVEAQKQQVVQLPFLRGSTRSPDSLGSTNLSPDRLYVRMESSRAPALQYGRKPMHRSWSHSS